MPGPRVGRADRLSVAAARPNGSPARFPHVTPTRQSAYPGNSAPAHGGSAGPVGWRTTAQSAFTGETLHPVGRLLTMPEHTLFTAPLNRVSVPKRCEAPTVLWDAVLNARAVWAEERHLPSQGSGCNARSELLHALEAYVRSLDQRGRPVPYALRDELRLVRLTTSSRLPRTIGT